jgi:nitrite reductase/ring-hydroxylating ferredoxin subunit
MTWTKALDSDELGKGMRRVVKLEGKPVLLIRHEGELYAVNNRCPHMGYPLKGGRIDDDCALHCPFHRSAFDLKSGDVQDWVVWPPGIGVMLGKLSKEKAMDVYPVKEEGGAIMVQLEGG